jgi:hypothetical protein
MSYNEIGDLRFSVRLSMLNPYMDIFSKEVYDKLWKHKWKAELEKDIKKHLRDLKLKRILKEK